MKLTEQQNGHHTSGNGPVYSALDSSLNGVIPFVCDLQVAGRHCVTSNDALLRDRNGNVKGEEKLISCCQTARVESS